MSKSHQFCHTVKNLEGYWQTEDSVSADPILVSSSNHIQEIPGIWGRKISVEKWWKVNNRGVHVNGNTKFENLINLLTHQFICTTHESGLGLGHGQFESSARKLENKEEVLDEMRHRAVFVEGKRMQSKVSQRKILVLSLFAICYNVSLLNWLIGRKKEIPSIGIRAKVVKAMASVEGDQSNTLAVVKPTARGASIPIHYPMLSETNYGIWAVKMKIILRSLGVWSVIEGADTDDDKDQGAMVAISQAVPDDVMMAIAEKQTAKEAWDALREMRIGEDRVKKARVQVLKRQLYKVHMQDSETVNEYSMKLTALVGEIRSLGAKLEESEVVEKLFSSVPDRFLQIIGTIEQFGDVDTMSVSEAIGRLRTFEEGLKGRSHTESTGEQLLFTQAEWEAKYSKGKKDEGSGSTKRGGRHWRGHGRGRGYGGGRGNGERPNEDRKPRNFDKSKVKCFNCNEFGHFAKDCSKPNRRERANFVTTQTDDEPALLMAETCVISHSIQNEHVLLHEDKVVPKIKGTREKAWYLDTGASNHMTGCIEKFAEIDTTITGSVKFGDGSTVKIQGRGSVLLEDFTGEHRILTNVYYIPMLKSNIISLGQLDENGCKVVIEGGVMTILDRLQRLLAKVKRSSNRLYVLNIAPALPECFLIEANLWCSLVSSDAAHQRIEEEMLYPDMASPQPGFYQSGEPENTSAGSNRADEFGSGDAQTPVSFLVEQRASEFIHPEASEVGPRGKRDLNSLYDKTIPTALDYSGL
ncbi:hypothetical protein DKX38_025915 [Salix brachista]|uniref:CCHC-type domain-containing protein n=1 Tax=Salix brachista TaxID=2182728 RepID=A0A5N5JS58_9ROSI|nr:hypothetical protein DKX38_025915 [Salix brachista]